MVTQSLTIKADLQYLADVGAAIKALFTNVAITDEALYNIELSVHEVCTNIIEHAYEYDTSAEIDIMLTLQDDTQFRAVLQDTGKTFDPNAVSQPNFDALQEGGLGLFLVHQLMHDVQYQHDGKYNIWHLAKELE